MNKIQILKITFLIIILITSGCNKIIYEKTESFMNTYFQIKVADSNENKAKSTVKEAFNEILRVEKKLSCYRYKNIIAEINKTGKVTTDLEVIELIKKSLYFSQITDGAFDITVYPLIKLWNFKKKKVPSKEQILSIVPLVNYKNIAIKGNIITTKGTSFDLGGIAKGYAVDCAAKILKNNGMKSGLVNGGGDLIVFGNKTWEIGLQHPRKPDKVLEIIPLKDMAIATSGDYEKYFIKNNKRYHHIMNPKTGYPAEGCMSVTIIAKDATSADALATGIFVLGPKKGMNLIESLPDIEGIIISSQGEILVSSGFKNKLNLKENLNQY